MKNRPIILIRFFSEKSFIDGEALPMGMCCINGGEVIPPDRCVLTESGKAKALLFAQKLKAFCEGYNLGNGLKNPEKIAFLASTAPRVQPSVRILQENLGLSSPILDGRLWTDNWHKYDPRWLEKIVRDFLEKDETDSKDAMIILTHLEMIDYFLKDTGLDDEYHSCEYGDAIIVWNTGEEIKKFFTANGILKTGTYFTVSEDTGGGFLKTCG